MLKNTLFVLAAASLCLTACKNDSKTSAENVTTAETPKLDQNDLKKTVEEAGANLAQMEQLIQELNNLPANVQTKQAAAIGNLLEELNGMREKEAGMVGELKAMLPPSAENTNISDGGSTDAGTDSEFQLKTYNEYTADMNRYHERLGKIKAEIKEFK